MLRWFLVSTLFTLAACSPKSEVKKLRWLGAGPLKPPSHITESIDVAKTENLRSKPSWKSLNDASIRTQRTQQTVGGFDIRGAHSQTVFFNNEVIGHTSLRVDPTSKGLQKDLDLFKKRKSKYLSQIKSKHPEFKSAKLLGTFIELDESGLLQKTLLGFVFELKDDTDVIEVKLNTKGKVLSRESVVSSLTDGLASVFVTTPRENPLEEVVFKSLLGNGTLTSPTLKVISASTPLKNQDHVFKYSVKDPNFSAVQAYFYANKTLEWFSTTLGLKLPKRLTVKVHVGAPVPRNVNFYYNGQVRLGDGDGKIYADIPRDPSIVSHEVSHAFIEQLAGFGQDKVARSMNEGFTDFFAASIIQSPKMAEFSYLKGPYRRTLENDLRAFKDFTGGTYHDSTVLSGTLWDLKQEFGTETTAQLTALTLALLGPAPQWEDFAPAITNAAANILDVPKQKVLKAALEKRGWF